MDQRSEKSIAALKQTMHDLLLTTPFDEITITQVAETAGLNRKTFYRYYKNLESLIADILLDIAADCLKDYRLDDDLEGFIAHSEQFVHGVLKEEKFLNVLEHCDMDLFFAKALHEMCLRQLRVPAREKLPDKMLRRYGFMAIQGSAMLQATAHWILINSDLPEEQIRAEFIANYKRFLESEMAHFRNIR